jgi:hypothetical protein
MLGEAIIFHERGASRHQREERLRRNNLHIGDLIVSGVDLLWNILKR